jgi:hypothetical protein
MTTAFFLLLNPVTFATAHALMDTITIVIVVAIMDRKFSKIVFFLYQLIDFSPFLDIPLL